MRIFIPRTVNRFLGLLGSAFYYRYMSTLDARYWAADPALDPKSFWVDQPYIYVFWHEYILLPVSYFGNCKVATITSEHQDAEIITHLSEFMGFKIFRGSSTRGGTKALRNMLKIGKSGYHLTMMPDGPQGPRRKMSVGTIYMASKLQIPLIPTGMGFHRPWRATSWDKFAIPRPFSRARLIFSPPIHIPKNLKHEELEDYAKIVEEALMASTQEAEAWAASGNFREGEMEMNHSPKHLRKEMIYHYPDA
ncbi:MAG: lysophospholipid acyltransferase family protein [Planctomycetia bacterium]|nr:lysophospholipid acyltransferase family protein [Planctomycetia bacterium]